MVGAELTRFDWGLLVHSCRRASRVDRVTDSGEWCKAAQGTSGDFGFGFWVRAGQCLISPCNGSQEVTAAPRFKASAITRSITSGSML